MSAASEYPYHWSDTLSLVFTMSVSFLGLVLNLILFYIVLKNTPATMKTYAIIIRMGVIVDVFNAIATFLSIPRVFITGNSLFLMFQGICTRVSQDRFLSSQLCFYCYTTELHTILLSHFLLMYSYIYRYRVIKMTFENVGELYVKLICYTTIFAFVVYIQFIYYVALSPQQEVDDVVRASRPELLNSTWAYNGIVHHDEPIHVFAKQFSFITAFIVLIVAGYCSFQISRMLRKIQDVNNIRAMHKSLLNVLRAQTINPFVSIVTVFMGAAGFSYPQMRIPIIENLTLLPFATLSFISPLVTILIIKPYKVAFFKIFGVPTGASSDVRQVTSETLKN